MKVTLYKPRSNGKIDREIDNVETKTKKRVSFFIHKFIVDSNILKFIGTFFFVFTSFYLYFYDNLLCIVQNNIFF